jgi:hypothetical protein
MAFGTFLNDAHATDRSHHRSDGLDALHEVVRDDERQVELLRDRDEPVHRLRVQRVPVIWV